MFQQTQKTLTQPTTSERPYPLNDVGCLPLSYKLTAKDFPHLLRDALDGIGGGRGGCTTDALGNLLTYAPPAELEKMTPVIVKAVTEQMQQAHDIISDAPQREAAYRRLIAEQGIDYQVRNQIIDGTINTATANDKLDHALGVLRHAAFHASKYINHAGSLERLLEQTFINESVRPETRERAGYYWEDIQKRNPAAFAAPERSKIQGHNPKAQSPKV